MKITFAIYLRKTYQIGVLITFVKELRDFVNQGMIFKKLTSLNLSPDFQNYWSPCAQAVAVAWPTFNVILMVLSGRCAHCAHGRAPVKARFLRLCR